MGKWVLYTQPNYAHPKPTHLPPLALRMVSTIWTQSKAQGWLKKAYHTMQSDDSAAQIWLWHQRLGHPSFTLLQKKFPSLFQHNNVSKFQCETCELAKHHRVSFPLSSNKSSAPFSLIHTGV